MTLHQLVLNGWDMAGLSIEKPDQWGLGNLVVRHGLTSCEEATEASAIGLQKNGDKFESWISYKHMMIMRATLQFVKSDQMRSAMFKYIKVY